MIKVLKSGNTFYFIQCPKCKCEFIYQNADIFKEFNEIKCPECEYWIKVDRTKIYNVNTHNKDL